MTKFLQRTILTLLIHILGLIKSILKFLITKHDDWPSEPLKNLVEDIFKNHKDWTLSAFTHPNFYSNYTEENIFSPDIIIFDWDYDVSIDTES